MGLIIDQQTLEDLNISGKKGTGSIYSLFNRTHTLGGAEVLESFFLYPLNDAAAINSRVQTIRYFRTGRIKFSFKGEWFDAASQYLMQGDERSRLRPRSSGLEKRIMRMISDNQEESMLLKGIDALVEIIRHLYPMVKQLAAVLNNNKFGDECRKLKSKLEEPWLKSIVSGTGNSKTNYNQAVEYDALFRFTCLQELKDILRFIYETDALISVAEQANRLGLVCAEALEPDTRMVEIKGLWHPQVKNAVRNDFCISPEKRISFLTGANMAGKSTFMKATGVAMLLAHAGIPVAAEQMRFAVCDAIFTTINLPDDLSGGHSHFYSEVLRIKKMGIQLGAVRNLFVIFDELFRGTNVKDAYEGTVAVSAALAERTNCMLVLSTHIIEAGEALQKITDKINYLYLPTIIKEGQPVYPRKVLPGISSDRHGMTIIRNEGILEMLRFGKK